MTDLNLFAAGVMVGLAVVSAAHGLWTVVLLNAIGAVINLAIYFR